MNEQDVRWKQRFSNFKKALKKLEESVDCVGRCNPGESDPDQEGDSRHVLMDLLKQGVIQSFEFTHELGWNVLKDYAAWQGNSEIRGSRDAVREAFAMGLIENGEVWMEMIKSRNQTTHTYDQDTANAIFAKITREYLTVFRAFREKMEAIGQRD